MKIVLINPPMSIETRFSKEMKSLEEVGTVSPPLGICYLAAILEKNGYDVEIVDSLVLNHTIKKAVDVVLQKNPDIVGITATTASINVAGKIARSLKENDKNIKIVIGGAHVSAMPEQTLSEFKFDIGVIGEGEYTLLDIVKAEEKNRNLKNIPGIVYSTNGKIFRTLFRSPPKNLDLLPFPASEL